jgi:hypothetical protein
MRTQLFSLALIGTLAALSGSSASAQEIGPFLGTYHTTGKQGWRSTKADIAIVASNGTLTITRTGSFTSRRYRRQPAFTFTSTDVTLDGDTLKVVYRLTKDGESLSMGQAGGLVSAMNGTPLLDSAGNPVVIDPGSLNIFNGTYELKDDGTVIHEKIRNTTKVAPEDFWRNIKTKGKQLTSTDPDRTRERIKLGNTIEVGNGKHPLVIPTDGTLTLEISAGTLALEDPSGNAVAAVDSSGTLTYEVAKKDPVLGIYTVVITDATSNEVLEAKFVQNARIDSRIRPWSSHTYYPIYQYSSDTSTDENEKTLFREDGPLAKFDKALSLEGENAARVWEMGGEYRTGFGFEHGHYVRLKSPSEERAEKDWKADLDRDGILETEGLADVFKAYDANEDGKIDEAEAKEQLTKGQVQVLWDSYDGNKDGEVDSSEIFPNFVTKHDKDASGGCNFEEWDAALRADYASLLEKRTKEGLAAFMKRDADADGLIVEGEMEQPGSVDFQDSSDVDGDFNAFFDRDNIKITTTDDEVHFGNKVEENGNKIKLFKGRKSDELVVELKKSKIKSRENGVADGDIDDSYSVGWWGHCNAWSLASIVYRKPTEEFEVNGVKLSVRDQKGILVERGMWDSEESTFWWKRAGDDEISPSWYAKGFHEQMHRWLRIEQKGMMADMDFKDPNNNLNFQVWNYPLLGYVAEIKEAEGDDPYVLDFDVKIEKGSYSDNDGSGFKSVEYRLQFNDDGSIDDSEETKTEWLTGGTTKKYIRYLIHPYRFNARGGSGNPHVTNENLEKLFGEHLKFNRIADIEAETAAAGGLGVNTAPVPTAGN